VSSSHALDFYKALLQNRMMRDEALSLALKPKGAAKRLAEALGITEQAVCQWSRVPAGRVLDVERATGVPRHLLRPDLYPREAAA